MDFEIVLDLQDPCCLSSVDSSWLHHGFSTYSEPHDEDWHFVRDSFFTWGMKEEERGGKRRNVFNLVSCDGIHKKKNMK